MTSPDLSTDRPARNPGPASRSPLRYLPAAGLAAAALAATGVVAAIDPNQAGHYPTCPFLALTGWYCPGCGALRAVHDLAHGHLQAALSMNPLLVVALPLLFGLYLNWWRRLVTGRSGPEHPPAVPLPLIAAVLVVVLAFWVLRNLPFAAFLAP